MNKVLYIILISLFSLIIISCGEDKEEYSETSVTNTDNKTTDNTTSDNTTSDNTTTDTTAPTVTSVSTTADDQSSVALTDNITVTFSEAMDKTTVTTNVSNTTCSGTLRVSSDNFSSCVQMSSAPASSNDNKTFTLDQSDNLTGGTNYLTRVTTGVKDAAGNAMSSQYDNSTGFTIPLPAPANLSATAGYKQVALDWDNVSGVSSYTVYWDNATGVSTSSTAITNVSDDNYTHTGLTGGTTYYYKVAGINSSGTGTLSSEVNATASSSQLIGGSMQGEELNLTTVVTTIAGTGSGPVPSVNGTGTQASFNIPWGITSDGTNLYVVDYGNHLIRKIVISSGVVTTVAGTGSSGSADGTGTAASFNQPAGITTDGTNLYVADESNNTIRKIVITSGVVTTLAGTAGSTGSTNATGASARFNGPAGITTDGINLYVTDQSMIRKIVISTGAVTTLAGASGQTASTDDTGTAARFHTPSGITTDGTNLYVADKSGHSIRKVVISTAVVTTIAGTGSSGSDDGTGTSASFGQPFGITTDGINLYVAEKEAHRIRKIVISSGVVTKVAGTVHGGSMGNTDATGLDARFRQPWDVTSDGKDLYVADSYNYLIRKID